MRAVGLAMLLVVAMAASAAETPADVQWQLPCETAFVEVGEPYAAWLRLDGWSVVEREGGRIARAARSSAILLLLQGEESRSLELVARGDGELLAAINGHPLGGHDLAPGWSFLRWRVPAGAIREGPNVVRFERHGAAARGFEVKRLRLEPSRSCGRRLSRAAVEAPAWPRALERGQLLVLRRDWSSPARLDVAVEMRGEYTTLTAFCLSERAANVLETMTGGRSDGAVGRFALDGDCAAGRGVALLAHGGAPARVKAAQVRPRGLVGWRRRIDLLLLVALLATAVAAALGRKRLVSLARRGSASMARDVLAVVGTALLTRLAFWGLYPRPGYAADSWEYLHNAKMLAAGDASLWRETVWHGWQSYIRPPGYFLFLAVTDADKHTALQPAVALQLLFSALAAGATYLMARAFFGRLAALAAGLSFALFVPSIATFSSIMTEPLYMLFMVSALAALCWTARRPRWLLAAASGALFGLAALVRAGPVALGTGAALLLLPALGVRRGLRSAAVLVGSMMLVVAPWSVRNSILFSAPMGVSNITVPNLLTAHPDPRFVPTRGLDLGSETGFTDYRRRVAVANRDGKLTEQSGAIVRSVVVRLLREPGTGVAKMWASTKAMVSPIPDSYLRRVLGDHRAPRVAWLTSLANLQLVFVLVTALPGILMNLGTRATWPLLAWLAASYLAVGLLFVPEIRFLLHLTPALMVFSGAALERWLGAAARRGEPAR